MNQHLAKPFAPETLLAVLTEAASCCPVPVRAEIELPLFDEHAFHVTARYLEPAVLDSYLEMIEERAGTLLGRLHAAGQDDPALPTLAHQFAGSAGLFGFTRASELARRFERSPPTASPDTVRLASLLIESVTDAPAVARLPHRADGRPTAVPWPGHRRAPDSLSRG